ELESVEIRQSLVPVIRVLLYGPDFVLDAPDAAKGAGAGVNDDFAQIVVVVLQSLFADDDVPATGERRHHEVDRARLGQLELDGVFIARGDLADRAEQDATRDADAF